MRLSILIARAFLVAALVVLPLVQSAWLSPAHSILVRGAWPALWVLFVLLGETAAVPGIAAAAVAGFALEGVSRAVFGAILSPLLLLASLYVIGRVTWFNPSRGITRFWLVLLLAAFFPLRAFVISLGPDDAATLWSSAPKLITINVAGYLLLTAGYIAVRRLKYAVHVREQS